MANGITIEHSANGEPIFARIDLRKYGKQLKEFFVKNKVQVESGKNMAISAKLQESINEAKRGEVKIMDLNNIWD